MSGITPLLDTLLHQVLGKRADTQPPRDLNQPVKPTSPADAPRALYSDSRLDARAGTSPMQGTNRAAAQTPHESTPPARQSGMTSTQTHLSSSGRTIANLLLRFPSPPSVLSTRAPLVSSGQPPDVSHVASRLENSIRDSGLFYESHLHRWYKGELPRQQLEREPQMWRALRFSPVPDASGVQQQRRLAPPLVMHRAHPSTPRHSTQTATINPTTTSPAPPLPADKPAALPTPAVPPAAESQTISRGDSHEITAARHSHTAARETIHESLQAIVRHQLEMLVTPALRWEGDVWGGLFMALLIQPPAEHQAPSDDSQDGTTDGDSQRTWRSDIDLEVQGAGRIKATVWMQTSRLEVDMSIADCNTLERLKEGLAPLQARLDGHGFENAGITLRRLTTEAPDATS